eukprot:767398-Prymnesium_polylepis.1
MQPAPGGGARHERETDIRLTPREPLAVQCRTGTLSQMGRNLLRFLESGPVRACGRGASAARRSIFTNNRLSTVGPARSGVSEG